MRKIVMFDRVSADGFFATRDGGIEWPTQDPELDAGAASGLDGVGTILFGRRTYDGFESFWPSAVSDAPESPSPHGPPRVSKELRAMGVWINAAEKLVFSRTRTAFPWHNSRLLGDFDPRVVAELKAVPGKDIMIFGSGEIVSLLTEHRLIDVYQLVVSPILLGGGKSIFGGISHQTHLALAECKQTKVGNVMLRYTLRA